MWLDSFFGTKNYEEGILDNVVCINVSNDKEFIPVYDKFGLPKGRTDIIDRSKLAMFFNILDNRHKYIFCNIRFDSLLKAPNDSLLQSSLNRLERIVVSRSLNSSSNELFDVQYAPSNYHTTPLSNRFIKYDFLTDSNEKSIALKLAEELDDIKIERHGMFFYSNESLCLKSLILNHEIKGFKRYKSNGVKNYYDLGVDILTDRTPEQVRNLVQEKIILLGDFEDRDMHQTLYGEMSGSIINFNAYLALKNGFYIIPLSLLITLTCIYFLITMIIVFGWDITFSSWFIHKIKKWRFIKTWNEKYHFNGVAPIVNHAISSYIELISFFLLLSVLYFIIYGIHIEIISVSLLYGALVLLRDWNIERGKRNNKKEDAKN